MSTIQNSSSYSFETSKSVIENGTFKNIKLLSIFMQAFSINNSQAKCIKCNVSCTLQTKNLLFHLMTCNGTLIEENDLIPKVKLNCLLCNFTTTNMNDWKHHLLKFNHIVMTYDSSETGYSYNCNSCNNHFYGFEETILQHTCKPKKLSKLSILMSYVYKNFNIHYNHMLYYCADCLHYTYDVNDLHIKKHCKGTKNSVSNVCKTCLITFYDSSKNDFLNHKMSFEHIGLWCLNGERTMPNTLNSLKYNLPVYIIKYFVIDCLSQKMCCIVCNTISTFSCEYIYEHYKKCISSNDITDVEECTPIRTIHCFLCHYQLSTPKANMYINWVRHVISFEHLSNTVEGKNSNKIYSYYCYVNETIFYGTECMIQKKILELNAEIGRLLFLPKVMAEVYSRLNTHLNFTVLFCCGLCGYYTNNPSVDCKHRYINIFYCSTCLIEFNVQSDYIEHLISNEHIFLKYFKPNPLGELKIIEHSMETLKICNMINSDDNHNECISSKSSINNEQISDQEDIESKENLDPKVNTSYFIDKLSAQPNKSAFNNHLRMKFELLNQMPHAINSFTKSSYYCTVCDTILCDQYHWSKHYKEIHSDINCYPEFYCAICYIYYIGSCININDHIKSMEHVVMFQFSRNMEKKSIKPIVNNNNSTPIQNQVLEVTNSKEHKYKKNKNVNIEIKDINVNLKRNNYNILRQIINEKYGEFKQISNKSNLFLIFFENTEQIHTLLREKDKLEKHYGFKIQIIEQNEDKLLSLETRNLFSDRDMLATKIFDQLNLMDTTLKEMKNQIKILCNSVCILNIGSDSLVAHVFGSRIYGLALKDSDVDLFLDIGDTFNGKISSNIEKQVSLVKKLAKQCLSKPQIFRNVEQICDARVPIVKFYHIPTKLNCDVSFKSGLSLYNTKLIELYLSMDKIVKWLACVIVKNWAPQNNLIGRNKFTSYGLIWLVLFYLMTKNIVPSVMKLGSNIKLTDRKLIEGWDCSSGNRYNNINIRNQDCFELLLGFFQYYTNQQNLIDNVLCTFTGKCLSKNNFYREFRLLSGINKLQRAKIDTFKTKIKYVFNRHLGLALQDPYELSFNITKHISDDNLSEFCDLCDQSVAILSSTNNCNTFGIDYP